MNVLVHLEWRVHFPDSTEDVEDAVENLIAKVGRKAFHTLGIRYSGCEEIQPWEQIPGPQL